MQTESTVYTDSSDRIQVREGESELRHQLNVCLEGIRAYLDIPGRDTAQLGNLVRQTADLLQAVQVAGDDNRTDRMPAGDDLYYDLVFDTTEDGEILTHHPLMPHFFHAPGANAPNHLSAYLSRDTLNYIALLAREGLPLQDAPISMDTVSGQLQPAILSIHPLPGGDSGARIWRWFIRREQRLQEMCAAMWESEIRFCQLFLLGPVPSVLVDSENSEIADINPAFRQLTKYTREEILQEHVQIHDVLSAPENGRDLKQRLLHEKFLRRQDVLVYPRSGLARDALLTATNVRFGGKAFHLIILEDVTSQKETERTWHRLNIDLERRVKSRTVEMLESIALMNQEIIERKQTEERLQQQHDFISAVMNTVGALVVVLDAQGRIVRFNRAGEDMTGYQETDILAHDFRGLLAAEDDRMAMEQVFRALEKGEKHQECEARVANRDGNSRVIFWTATRLQASTSTKEGDGGYIIIGGIDVTEPRVLAAELRHSEKMAVLGRVAAGIAHEIGNPLASMSARLQRMRNSNDAAFWESSVSLLLEQISRMTRILRTIATFSRAPSQEWCACEIAQILEEVVRILHLDRRSRQVQISMDIPEPLPITFASKDQLQQVFLNIGLNALDAMPDGGLLNISATANGDILRLAFKDTGNGIPEHVRQNLFNMFFTTKPEGMGTGIGLALSYDYVEAHGGRIEVESAGNNGSCFTVVFPVRAVVRQENKQGD